MCLEIRPNPACSPAVSAKGASPPGRHVHLASVHGRACPKDWTRSCTSRIAQTQPFGHARHACGDVGQTGREFGTMLVETTAARNCPNLGSVSHCSPLVCGDAESLVSRRGEALRPNKQASERPCVIQDEQLLPRCLEETGQGVQIVGSCQSQTDESTEND